MRTGRTARKALTFARAARRYWLEVYPQIRCELSFWHGRALAIPDPVLRENALFTQRTKAGNSEGAAAFAVLVPRASRRATVRLLVAFELLADYLDTLSELEAGDVRENNRRLHLALGVALGLEGERDDYYEFHPRDEDGGYMAAHISVCRELVAALPAYEAIEGHLRRLVACYIDSQHLNHTGAPLEEVMRTEQMSREVSRYPELGWREVVAAGGSTLAMLALLAAATDPRLTAREAELIVSVYYPSANSLHIMLDSLIDLARDRSEGAANQIDGYGSPREACERLAFLAAQSRDTSALATAADLHAVIIAGMAGYYLAQPEAWRGVNSAMSQDVLETLGPMTRATALVHRLNRGGGARSTLRLAGA